jgi:hypothetical protein
LEAQTMVFRFAEESSRIKTFVSIDYEQSPYILNK